MFILINKPIGPTSYDVIDQLRQITGIKKIGHAGTLDPFAQGLLMVAIGRESTRELSYFVGLDKEYLATLQLGAVSNSYDCTGNIKRIKNPELRIKKNEVKKVIKNFIGQQDQLPPMFSAKKIKGKKLYQLARQGITIERKLHQIKIHDIQLIDWQAEKKLLIILVVCGSGTYIRTLAHDIGQRLGSGAYLEKLVRTKIGKHKLTDAVSVDKLSKNNWQSFCFQ